MGRRYLLRRRATAPDTPPRIVSRRLAPPSEERRYLLRGRAAPLTPCPPRPFCSCGKARSVARWCACAFRATHIGQLAHQPGSLPPLHGRAAPRLHLPALIGLPLPHFGGRSSPGTPPPLDPATGAFAPSERRERRRYLLRYAPALPAIARVLGSDISLFSMGLPDCRRIPLAFHLLPAPLRFRLPYRWSIISGPSCS